MGPEGPTSCTCNVHSPPWRKVNSRGGPGHARARSLPCLQPAPMLVTCPQQPPAPRRAALCAHLQAQKVAQAVWAEYLHHTRGMHVRGLAPGNTQGHQLHSQILPRRLARLRAQQRSASLTHRAPICLHNCSHTRPLLTHTQCTVPLRNRRHTRPLLPAAHARAIGHLHVRYHTPASTTSREERSPPHPHGAATLACGSHCPACATHTSGAPRATSCLAAALLSPLLGHGGQPRTAPSGAA